ncbi:MAG TPA: hypothetical protein VFP49_03120 [Nitrososphaeraceae archaeon]|jgi:hypothetical protein|nr:hypothetical protein [Nitrososphaeraceae archaeon]
MIHSYDSYTETLEKQKQKDNDIEELKRSVAFLADRFNAFLLNQPQNRIVYDDDNEQIKGIELKPELNNKAEGEIAIPSSNSSSNNNKKK